MMQTELSTTRLPSARPHRALDATRTAATAFAALLLRYLRDDAIAFDVNVDDGGPPRRVHVNGSTETRLAALAAQIRPQLAGVTAARPRLRLSWSDSGGHSLSLAIRVGDVQVDAGASSVRGLFATREAVASVARHFEAIRRALASDPSARLGDVAIVTGADLRRVRDELSAENVAPDLATPGLLHAIFEERARRHPDRIAAVCDDERVTYADLDARAERVARALRSRGIGAGSFVALCLPRSIDVYVALLGVLKSGAAYVPIDPECPPDRARHIVRDCRAAVVLTCASLADDSLGAPAVRIDEASDLLPAPGPSRARAATSTDVAYVIYTSGSTGKPKGVAVTHASVVHLVRAEQRLFAVREDDRVFQGFSIAFDAAVEEIWLAFAAGATLVAGKKERILGDLAGYLTEQRVTVLSTVPTLLASIEAELPMVRILIVGGEVCPQPIADRWAAPPRAMFNTYGPTEATVIATIARLAPGAKVTIGRPIPNYRTYVVDRAGHLAPHGMAGEICIGGPGLARGYVGNAELTAARFGFSAAAGQRVYRTGDLGRFDDDGNLEFLGRVDEQVKLRGFRIELGEIESALLGCDAVAQAAAVLRNDALVAYVVARAGSSTTEDALKSHLAASLPPYMVPSRVVLIASMPTLTSGKIDKKALPSPAAPERSQPTRGAAPRNPIERAIADVWARAFGLAEVPRDGHFFLELGGHSLLAAKTISELRREPGFASLSVLDLYEHPTVAKLAAAITRRPSMRARAEAPEKTAARSSFVACALAQLVALYGVFGVYSVHWLAPYLTYVALRRADAELGVSLAATGGVLLAVHPLLLLLAATAKWLVIGTYKPGRYPLWGAYYLRFWLVERMLAIAPTSFLVGTPLLAAYYRLLGARIGANVHLASDAVRCFDLVSIGDDAALGAEATIAGYTIENGELVIGGAQIGARAAIGARSVLAPGARVGDDACVEPLSLVRACDRVPNAERWAGSPARFVGHVDANAKVARPTPGVRALFTAIYAVVALLLPLLVVAALFPGLVALNALERHVGALSIAAAPMVAVVFIVLLCLEIAIVKWVVLGRARAGRYDLWSGFALRRWIFDRAMSVSLDVVGGLYATLYLTPWYRLLGVRLGKNAEVSTASALVPDLVRVGEEAFLADCVSLGAPRIERGTMKLEETRIGARAFIGNSAVVPPGADIADDSLVGCLSTPPDDRAASTKAGSSWFGSPPLPLLQRQASAAFPVSTTYRPTRRLVALRLAIEALRVTLPTTCFVALTCLLIDAAVALYERLPLAAFVASFPLLYVAFGIAAALLVIATKWIVVGRYRPGERPLWSTFVWRTELVTAMHENLADPFFNELLRGTPFAAWFFRALGARIGRRVYMGTTQLTEYDLVTVGDEACLNEDCTLQTHLFEDRVMKMSTVTIGEGASVGADAIVLYDATMKPKSRLAPLSIVMKGETLPEETRWEGSPARAAR